METTAHYTTPQPLAGTLTVKFLLGESFYLTAVTEVLEKNSFDNPNAVRKSEGKPFSNHLQLDHN